MAYGTRVYLFLPDEGSCYVLRLETFVSIFLHVIMLNPLKTDFPNLIKCIYINMLIAVAK